jgi:hypothetical protein
MWLNFKIDIPRTLCYHASDNRIRLQDRTLGIQFSPGKEFPKLFFDRGGQGCRIISAGIGFGEA